MRRRWKERSKEDNQYLQKRRRVRVLLVNRFKVQVSERHYPG